MNESREVTNVNENGWILLLNGGSSSGKSTLAKELQNQLAVPALQVSSDSFLEAMLPERWVDDEPLPWWRDMREQFFSGFHRSIAGFASAGNNLIVDHLLEKLSWRSEMARLTSGLDVFLVGVHCEPDEINRREIERGDRAQGEGRTHIEIDRVHSFGPYDFEVDTTIESPSTLANQTLIFQPTLK